jgi:hypothetical protein
MVNVATEVQLGMQLQGCVLCVDKQAGAQQAGRRRGSNKGIGRGTAESGGRHLQQGSVCEGPQADTRKDHKLCKVCILSCCWRCQCLAS